MNNSKEKILILFNGAHVAYSPTVIQLYDFLVKKYDVTIIAQDPNNYTGQGLNDRKVRYHKYFNVKGRHFFLVLFKLLVLFNKEARLFKRTGLGYKDYFFRFLFVKKYIRKGYGNKAIISVDNRNVFYCSILGIKTDFLSLELCSDEQLLPLIDQQVIRSVLIQSPERYAYLLKDAPIKTFFVQNSPVYSPIKRPEKRLGLVYSGGAYNFMGFYDCLNFLSAYPDEKLTVQGAVINAEREKINRYYGKLLQHKQLVIKSEYLDNDDVVEFLSQYEIGFCLYNFQDPFISKHNYYNYVTAPSGKLFKYLAAGVPVICNNIIGFQFVNDFQCGVLIDTLDPATMHAAVVKIREQYDQYVENAIKAASHFSFDKGINPYVSWLEGQR